MASLSSPVVSIEKRSKVEVITASKDTMKSSDWTTLWIERKVYWGSKTVKAVSCSGEVGHAERSKMAEKPADFI